MAGVDKVSAHCEDAIAKGAKVIREPCTVVLEILSGISAPHCVPFCDLVYRLIWLVLNRQVRIGGKRLPEVGVNFFAPTVLTDVLADALVR